MPLPRGIRERFVRGIASDTFNVQAGDGRHQPFNRLRRRLTTERRLGAVGELCGPVVACALADNGGHGFACGNRQVRLSDWLAISAAAKRFVIFPEIIDCTID